MRSFRDAFAADLGHLIEEVVIGSGPCGELRYPSYVEANGWRFPGVRLALLVLTHAAAAAAVCVQLGSSRYGVMRWCQHALPPCLAWWGQSPLCARA